MAFNLPGLTEKDLLQMLGLAKKSLKQPGEPVEIPHSLFGRIDGAVEAGIVDELFELRERERSSSSEIVKLRLR